jgi:hypothetical protein
VLVGDGKSTVLLKPDQIQDNKPQGDIGLTVTDAGYDFGPIPDWVLSQRKTSVSYTWPLNRYFT